MPTILRAETDIGEKKTFGADSIILRVWVKDAPNDNAKGFLAGRPLGRPFRDNQNSTASETAYLYNLSKPDEAQYYAPFERDAATGGKRTGARRTGGGTFLLRLEWAGLTAEAHVALHPCGNAAFVLAAGFAQVPGIPDSTPFDITFDSPLPVDDYMVLASFRGKFIPTSNVVHDTFGIRCHNQSRTGFKLVISRTDNTAPSDTPLTFDVAWVVLDTSFAWPPVPGYRKPKKKGSTRRGSKGGSLKDKPRRARRARAGKRLAAAAT